MNLFLHVYQILRSVTASIYSFIYHLFILFLITPNLEGMAPEICLITPNSQGIEPSDLWDPQCPTIYFI